MSEITNVVATVVQGQNVVVEAGLAKEARELFGDYYYLTPLKEPLDSEKNCMRIGCKGKRAKSILIDIWGHVLEYHVCDKCVAGNWHGRRVDEPGIFEVQE